jgi:hypothetical protein
MSNYYKFQAGESDSAADTGLLDSSTESLENTEVDSIQMELASLSVSRDASPTQMTGQHPAQMQMGALTTGKEHLDGMRDVPPRDWYGLIKPYHSKPCSVRVLDTRRDYSPQFLQNFHNNRQTR